TGLHDRSAHDFRAVVAELHASAERFQNRGGRMIERQDPFAKFQGVINSLEEIRECIGEPVPQVVAKVIDHIDPVSRAIIEKSPFIVIASATPDGYPDISLKGDPIGFVKVLDEKYLAIPDRPGNKRIDTFGNLLRNPYLAILFMI